MHLPYLPHSIYCTFTKFCGRCNIYITEHLYLPAKQTARPPDSACPCSSYVSYVAQL